MVDASPVILVTGASSGIGRATALLFAQHGYRVVAAARRLDRLQSLSDEIATRGGEALLVQADVSSLVDIQHLVQSAMDHYGRIDVLFNNAGIGRLRWLEDLDPISEVEQQVQVDLLGTIWTAQAVLPHMIARRKGHIINMSSIAGYIATPTYTVYAASKFGVRGFTDALRREVGVYGIHVSLIAPGGTRTEFADRAGIQRKTKKTTPALLRLEPETVARRVLSLVNHPRRSLILPWPMRLATWFEYLFPGIFDWIVEARFTRLERKP